MAPRTVLKRRQRNARRRSGVILLVVLSMLTFLGLLVVTYVAFSSSQRRLSNQLATSQFRAPDVRGLFDEAIMKMLRDTDDPTDRFFGQSFLADYFGMKGSKTISVERSRDLVDSNGDLMPARRPIHVSGTFVRFPIDSDSLTAIEQLDDYFTGRTVTFLNGPLENHSFRVVRSIGARGSSSNAEYENINSLFIELKPELFVTLSDGSRERVGDLLNNPSPHTISCLFYRDDAGAWGGNGVDDDGDMITDELDEAGYPLPPSEPEDTAYSIYMNPVALNGMGIGYNGGSSWGTTPVAGKNIPIAMQPNTTANNHATLNKTTFGGDYDESYDAPDFNNMFLSGRVRARLSDGTIKEVTIPSYHRPALINYLGNLKDWSDSPTSLQFRQVLDSYAGATFRPLTQSNQKFTGSNTNFGMTTQVRIPPMVQVRDVARLQLLTEALVNGPWDVDNSGDGQADSVWIDIGLPLITSPEGKLLRPLVAPLVEDTSSKVNLNTAGTHSHFTGTDPLAGGITPGQFAAQSNSYRGLVGSGVGPGEISPLALLSSAETEALLQERYYSGLGSKPDYTPPGQSGRDPLSALLMLNPASHGQVSALGYSADPFGTGIFGIGTSGRLVQSGAGVAVGAFNEQDDHPYEFDPTGNLSGDSAFTLAEWEAVLRANSWDADLLPQRLRNVIDSSLTGNPRLGRMVTTSSSSMDTPVAVYAEAANRGRTPRNLMRVLADQLGVSYDSLDPTADAGKTQIHSISMEMKRLVAPELRLGRKLDVNRPIGNMVDDNLNGVFDEPIETDRFPTQTQTQTPNPNPYPYPFPGGDTLLYNRMGRTLANQDLYAFGENNQNYVNNSGRELLARHLYVLMMMLKGQGYQFPLLSGANGTEVADPNEYDAHRLAQWAVNVVDYRDPDSIMTRFVYDPDPLDGWHVAGADTNNNGVHDEDEMLPTARVVWGCESPELVFTESAAFHDVRVRDTTLEHAGATGRLKGDPNNPDPTKDENDGRRDTDQIRVPQGSLFLELYVNRQNPSNNEAQLSSWPGELYTTNGLQLGRRAPLGPGDDGVYGTGDDPDGAPVWRIAISEPHYPGSDAEAVNPQTLRQSHPNTYSFDPANPFLVTDQSQGGDPNLEYDRYIVFTDHADFVALTETARAMSGSDNKVFGRQLFFVPTVANPNVGTFAQPGEYIVLAPRADTHFGSKQYTDPDGDDSVPDGDPSTVAIPEGRSNQSWQFVNNRGLVRYNINNVITNRDLTEVSPSRMLEVKTFPPVNPAKPSELLWAEGIYEDNRVGLNVSEPMPNGTSGYYTEPDKHLDSGNMVDYPYTDAYVDYDDTSGSALDRPADLDNASFPIRKLSEIRKNSPDPDEPFLGTQREYCSAFLQRLADPTRSFNEDVNPYITVDWIPIDLTVFSGEESPKVIAPNGYTNHAYAQRTRERNGQDSLTTASNSLFTFNSQGPGVAGGILEEGGDNYFQFTGGADTVATGGNDKSVDSTFGYLNLSRHGYNLYGAETYGMANPTATANLIGQPNAAFAIHDWLNRPFASHYELLMVPATSPARLFQEFSVTVNNDGTEYYNATAANLRNVPHRHLINFFHSQVNGANSAQFARLFDYVHTLPRFKGEVDYVRPDQVHYNTSMTAQGRASRVFSDHLQAPFSFTYDNVRQGTINPNTLSDHEVYQSWMYTHLRPSNTGLGERGYAEERTTGEFLFQNFQASRRGFVPADESLMVFNNTIRSNDSEPYNFGVGYLNGHYPTQFARPFRTAADADLMPILPQSEDGVNISLARSPVNGTLMRADSDLAAVDQHNPWFVRPAITDAASHPHHNPFMKYQTLMRMPNLTAPQSNVLAVRMTMGFFEVDADTLSLGKEYKLDEASNKRHQMMYIIDRSKPVAFIAGQNTNARDAIVYERLVE